MQLRPGRRLDASIDQFRRDLRVLEREIVRQLEGETTCCGVTLPQCHVLIELSFGDRSLKALASALELDKSTLSRTVDGMVRAGLVERTTAAGDRRAVRLTLSAQGHARVGVINDMCNRHYAAVLGQMGAADRRQVVRVVRLLAAGLRHQRGAETGQPPCCAPDGPAKRRKASRRATATGRTAPRPRSREV
jgi:DNA-binding MarR family transcriptional regulator